jgi:hypothetical protein
MEKRTGCECPLAGLCNRHGMNKTAHYFNQWENCQGPGQNQVECLQNKAPQASEEKVEAERPQKELQLPTMAQQAKNFAGSWFKHALSGFGKVDEDTYGNRLSECVNCEFYMENIGRCSKCGCPCASKASWKSSSCPVGKW